jgi:hypothetical protein
MTFLFHRGLTCVLVATLLSLATFQVKAQQSLTTIDGWNAYVHLPADYNTNSGTYPVIIFIAGIGEIGTDPSAMLAYGPSKFIADGHNMQFTVNGVVEKPIVISIQPTAAWPSATVLNKKIDVILSTWRVNTNRVYLTGLSMGGWSWDNYVSTSQAYANRIAAIVAMSAPPPNTIDNMTLFANAGGKWWGFEGTQDYRKMDVIRDLMNAAVAGSARYTKYNGGHCCWNTWYNPEWTESGENIYTWLLKHNKGGVTEPANQAPVANAGNDVTITLPISTAALAGSGTDADGSIVSYSWAKTAGPAQFTITTPNTAQTTVTNLAEGTYTFELTVTDNKGATAKDNVQVIVKPAVAIPPVTVPPPTAPAGTANAGNDTLIYLNQVAANTATLNGAGSQGATSYLWTKVSGPGNPVIVNPTAAVATVTNIQEGVYEFALTINGTQRDVMLITARDFMKKNIRPCRTGQPQAFTLAKTSTTELYRPYLTRDNVLPNLMGGDTLYIPGGVYTKGIEIGDIAGGPGCPIVIAPKDEPVVLKNDAYFRVAVKDTAVVAYAKFDGTLLRAKGHPFGWVVDNSDRLPAQVTGVGLAMNWVHNMDISGYYTNHTALGLMVKLNAKEIIQGQYDKFVLKNIRIFDNYIFRSNGEGMYIGHTGISGTAAGNSTAYGPPPRMDKIEIFNNIIDSTDWDGIQLSNALSGCKIYKNIVRRYGLANHSSQQAGILSGANIDGVQIFDNMTVNGTGTGIAVFGYNRTSVYHNIVDSVKSGKGIEHGTYLKRNDVAPEIVSPLIPVVTNNIFKDAEAYPVYTYAGPGTTGGEVSGNYFINNGQSTVANNSGAAVSNNKVVQNFPIKVNSVGQHSTGYSINITQGDATRTFNRVDSMVNWIFSRLNPTAQPNIPPVVNAGNDVTITLPVSTVTLTGTATDADGSIASVQWRKISGPANFTIVAPAQLQTAINGLAAGVYGFELTATDNSGAAVKDTVNVTVNPAANQAPIVSAGNNVSITLPVNTVTLNGAATDADGTIASVQWRKVSGPSSFNIVSPAQLQTVINGLVAGVYSFELSATDNSGATSTATVSITVNTAANQAPTVHAGNNVSITLPANTVTLTGTANDADGTIASVQWRKVSGPANFNIVSPAQLQTVINGLTAGVYSFELSATDNSGAISTATVNITVNTAANQAPTVHAGNNVSITLPANTVTLTGTATDADGTIASVQWRKVSGPANFNIVSPAQLQTVINGLTAGVYSFELTATDNSGATATATVSITVNPAANQAPTVHAGNNVSITLPTNTVTLTGTATDADGSIVTVQWRKISGPANFNIVSPAQLQTVINGLTAGVYSFELSATDNGGATTTATVSVTVNTAANQTPTANAGNNVSITLPVNTVTLTGTASDADGTITSVQWRKLGGPASFNIVSPSQLQTVINELAQGVYTFELTVTDNNGATASSVVSVTVNPAPNQAPTAHAGNNISITLPANSVTLTGTANDADGTITNIQWRKLSGPAGFNIVSPGQLQTVINGLETGVYSFELTVTDNSGATASATVSVTVNPAVNQAPTVHAGNNVSITLPNNTVTLNGTANDADGTITNIQWRKINGPVNFNIVSPSQLQTVINGLVAGLYSFELTVTDNNGATATAVVNVTVNPANNQAPTVNAGNSISITLPVNTVTLNGSANDGDGFIANVQWRKLSGPGNFNIVSPSQLHTVVNELVAGVYRFELTVTDNSGATASATVSVTVTEIPQSANQSPVANAGKDLSITLPDNEVVLIGAGSDPDGSIVSKEWRKISGPSSYVILDPTEFTTTIKSLELGTYSFELTVTDDQGATGKDTVSVNVVQPDVTKLELYPNPVTNQHEVTLVLTAAVAQNKGSIVIVDTKGTIVLQEEFSGHNVVTVKKIDVSRLVKGVYFITVRMDKNLTKTVKLLKQ